MRQPTPVVMSVMVLLMCAAGTPWAGDAARTVEFHGGSVFRFADVEKAKEFIGTADEWVKAFGPFDRALRARSQEPVSEEAFLEFAVSHVRDWDDEEVANMTEALSGVCKKIDALNLRLDLPDEILLIQTSGAEEGNVGGYTRLQAIIIPESQAARPAEELHGFILHELFHVMTRHNPAIREPLYGVIGFKACNEIKYPRPLIPVKITNPDAYHFDTYITLESGGKSILAVPLTLTKSETYTEGGIFDYVEIKFLQVELNYGIVKPKYASSEPVLLGLDEVSGFWEQIGKNTNYIVHPEEIMAVNFSYAVQQKKDLPNPEIPAAVVEILSAGE